MGIRWGSNVVVAWQSEKILHRQFKVHMATPLFVVVKAIEFAESFSCLAHLNVVRYQLRVRILLQEEMPELLEICTESMSRAYGQVFQKCSRVAIELRQPQ
jgi:hypothetical protein